MDAQDRILKELFATPAVRDDGFSERVLRRVRRRLLLRRVLLAAAVGLGGLVAFGPLLQLGVVLATLLQAAAGLLGGITLTLTALTLGNLLFGLGAVAVMLAVLQLAEE